jgi:hypothetical protein
VIDPLEPSSAQLVALLHAWACQWGLPGFEQHITIRLSRRLTRSLGRCNPAAGTITLRRGLTMDQIPYVLCHEAAHIATFLLFGAGLKPHGPEWASLVAAAGFTPSVRYPGAQLPILSTQPFQTGRFRYAHQCLVCQTTRWARRPVRGWRCAQCLALGLTGEMKLIDTQSQDAPP